MIQDAARLYTDAELKKLEREIHRAYKKAYAELEKKWQDAIMEAAEKEKPLIEALQAAKRTGDKELIRKAGRNLAAVQRENTFTNQHYRRVRDSLARQLAELDQAAYALANGKLPAIYSANFNVLAGQLPAGYAYGLITPQTVRNLLTKELNLVKATTWNAKLMNEQVAQGILQGESMSKIAKRFANVLGMNEQSAIRNARTSVTYAENQGRLDSYHEAEQKGTVLVKVWSATHDNLTRDSHRNIDGEEKDPHEKFSNGCMSPGDPHAAGAEIYNCRCAMGTRIVGFKRKDGSIVYV